MAETLFTIVIKPHRSATMMQQDEAFLRSQRSYAAS